jgi:hypothetical protein
MAKSYRTRARGALFACCDQAPYRFIRDQGYEVVEGKFVRRERDHDQNIGYDSVNQLFWYPECIPRVVTTDKVRHTHLLK